MHWRNTILGSSGLLSAALFATMVYSMVRLLGAGISPTMPAELSDVAVATQAAQFGVVDSAADSPDDAVVLDGATPEVTPTPLSPAVTTTQPQNAVAVVVTPTTASNAATGAPTSGTSSDVPQ